MSSFLFPSPFLLLLLLLLSPPTSSYLPPPSILQSLLSTPNKCHVMPCCYDGLTARLISGHPSSFNVTFMSGFGVAASLGYSDTQIVTAEDMYRQSRVVCEALVNARRRVTQPLTPTSPPLPCIADGDTGHGGRESVRRTVFSFGRAGMAGVMIEDQAAPKRCGHVDGKRVVGMEEAVERVRAAVRARDEFEQVTGLPGPRVLARTDARGSVDYKGGGGFEEAVKRTEAFRDAGADMLFLESPRTVEEMRAWCDQVPGVPKLYNSLEGGKTPIVAPETLAEIGFSLAAYPLTMLSAGAKAQERALDRIAGGEDVNDLVLGFEDLKEKVRRWRGANATR